MEKDDPSRGEKKYDVLAEMIRVLITKWGAKAVYRAIDGIVPEQERRKLRQAETRPSSEFQTPVQMVDDLEIDQDRKAILIEIARSYESGSFLKTIGDVKRFLAVRGISTAKIKSRSSSFKAILPTLSNLSPDGLERELRRGANSGPARLGPLADAIRESGAHRRERSDDLDARATTENDENASDNNSPIISNG